MKKQLYALFVGINNYPKPLSSLNGCIKDLDQLEKFVNKHVKGELDVQMLRLEDENATYANVIKSWRDHLRKASPEDVVWFHFSGHGSEEGTAKEFLKIEPNGKDQTIICYDSRLPGGNHIADKEFAALLHEVATQDDQDRPKAASPHIVVSLDCCHSGSGTRDIAEEEIIGSRAARPSTRTRAIETYLYGYYQRQGENIDIPLASHVLLSGCESVQTAGDLPSGGAFTMGLTRALNSADGNISYADLYMRARSSVKKIRGDKQTPQFETIGSFNPYTRFLDGSPLGNPHRYEIFKEDGDWYIQCGAIHGLPTRPAEPIKVDIQKPAPDNKSIGEAVIVSVGAQRSKIDVSGEFKMKQMMDSIVPGQDNYRGVLFHLPAPPEQVLLTGDNTALDLLKELWDESKNVLWVEDGGFEVLPSLEVLAEDGKYYIFDHKSCKRAWETEHNNKTDAEEIIESLGRIVQWRRSVKLENSDAQSQLQDLAQLEIVLHDTKRNKNVYKGGELKFYAGPENSMKGQFGFQPQVRVKAIDQNLYFYLFHLRQNYAIQCYEGEIVYRPEEHSGREEVILPLWKKIFGWGLSPGEEETMSYFKLFITSEPLDYQQLEQSGLGKHRDTVDLWAPDKISDDWWAITTRATILRQENAINPHNVIAFAHGDIKIKPHTGVSAMVSLGTALTGEQSADPGSKLAMFDSKEMQLVDFNDLNVLELNDISVVDPQGLVSDPLVIELSTTLDDNTTIIPLSFDGQRIRSIGDSVVQNGKALISIREIPDISSTADEGLVKSPFEEKLQDSSLFQSLKIAFYKVAQNREGKAQLGLVDLFNAALET